MIEAPAATGGVLLSGILCLNINTKSITFIKHKEPSKETQTYLNAYPKKKVDEKIA
jgi:hypothetical protein